MFRSAHALLIAAALAVVPRLGAAQASSAPPSAPSSAPLNVTGTVSLAGGAELGLGEGEGKAGLGELEATIGYELESLGIRPELGLVLGLAPDSSFALRPGARFAIRGVPFQFRAALDASSSRRSGLGWRWLLLGVAAELRFTSVLGLFAELDSGAPLSSAAGLPLLFRGGATFRF
jgi:hypothetical protein